MVGTRSLRIGEASGLTIAKPGILRTSNSKSTAGGVPKDDI